MGITLIGGTTRATGAQKSRSKSQASAAGPDLESKAKGAALHSPLGSESLRTELMAVVASLDLNDPAALEQVMPVVIRKILLRSLGSRIEAHPDFEQMLSRLEAELQREDHQMLWKEFVTALRR